MKYSIISSYHSFSRIVEQTLRFDHYFVHQSSSNFSIYYQFRKILQQKDENLENPETPCVLNVSSSPRLHFINVLAFSSSIRRLLQFSILSFIFQTSFTISLSAQNLFDDKKTLEKAAGNAGLTIHVRMADDPSQYPLNWSAILQDSQTGTNLDTAYVANSDSVHWPNLPTDIKDYDGIPLKFWLGQSYPNPFNPSAKIPFSLDKESKAQMNIYNVNGELVKKLFDGHEKAGKYEAEWAGDNDDGKTVAAGVYFYQLITDDGILVGKMANLGGYGKSPSNLSAGQFDESKAQNNGKAVKKGQFGEQGYKVEIRAHEDSTHPYFENQLVTLNNLASDSIIYLALSRVIKPIKLDSIENFSFLEDSLPRDSTIGKIKARGYDPNGYATTLQFSLSQTNPELLRVFLDSAAIKADSLKKDGNGQVEITYRAATPWTNAERKFNVKVLPLADIIIDAFANGKPVGYYKVDVKDSVGNVFYTQSTGSSNHVELSNMEKPVSSLEILLTDSSKMYFPPNVINFSPPFTGDTSLVVDLFNQVPVNIDVTSLVQMLSGNVPGKYEIVQLKQNGNVLQEKNTGEAGNVMFADVARNKNYTISVLGDTASRPNINAKDTLLFIDKDTAIVVNPGLYLRAAALNSLENKTFNEDEFPANPILHDLWTKATGYDSLGNQAGANAFQYLVLSQTNPNLAPVIIQANQYTKLDSLLSDGNGPNNVTVKAVAPNNMSDQKGFSVTILPMTDVIGKVDSLFGNEGPISGAQVRYKGIIVNTDANGNYGLQVSPNTNLDTLVISKNGFYERRPSPFSAQNDKVVNENMVDTSLNMNFVNATSRGWTNAFQRWTTIPNYYINTNPPAGGGTITQAMIDTVVSIINNDLPKFTDNYFHNLIIEIGTNPPAYGTANVVRVEWDNTIPGAGEHGEYTNGNQIYSAYVAMLTGVTRGVALQELSQTLGPRMDSNIVPSVFNTSGIANFYKSIDLKLGKFIYNRNPGNLSPDKDK